MRRGFQSFEAVASFPDDYFEWLSGRLDTVADERWVRSVPKIDLHTHLGGFGMDLTHLKRLASLAADCPHTSGHAALIASLTEEPNQLSRNRLPDRPIGLFSYLACGDMNGTKLLRSPLALREQVRSMYASFVADGVVYAEVRCSPQNYSTTDRPAWTVLQSILDEFSACRAADEAAGRTPCRVNIIIIATRKEGGDMSDISRHLSLAITAWDYTRDSHARSKVVGVDLAGMELKGTRPRKFAADFQAVKRCGLFVTVHAGESDDCESIWQAVNYLNADRIGHGLELVNSKDLLRVFAHRRIAVELCPYANAQVVGFEPHVACGRPYPLRKYLDLNIRATVNTDNIGISCANLTDNILLAADMSGLTRAEVLKLQSNALKAAFMEKDEQSEVFEVMNQVLSETARA